MVFDANDGSLTEVDDTGDVASTVTLGYADRPSTAASAGFWHGLFYDGTDYTLSAIAGPEATEPEFAFLAGVGNEQHQRAPSLWSRGAEAAAIKVLHRYLPLTLKENAEYAGMICQKHLRAPSWQARPIGGGNGWSFPSDCDNPSTQTRVGAHHPWWMQKKCGQLIRWTYNGEVDDAHSSSDPAFVSNVLVEPCVRPEGQ